MATQLQLPVADAELIRAIELEMRSNTAHTESLSAARFRYAWALVHADEDRQIKRGLKLVTSMMKDKEGDMRDLEYLMAVGQYKLGRYIDARKTLNAILELSPHFHQAEALKAAVEAQIVRDGLVGLGIGAAVLGLVGAVAAGALLGSKR